MHVEALGHVALWVKDLHRAEEFYAGVLGLTVSGHMGDGMTFLRIGDDRFQDIALMQQADGSAQRGRIGLDHIALRIGSSLDDLRNAAAHLRAHDIATKGPIDHTWSASLYLADPDGNGIELYVDRSDVWRSTPDFTPTAVPLSI